MMRQLSIFFIALQFFTRLPIPRWVGYQPEWVRASARFFPLIGILIGLLTAALLLLVAHFLPLPLAVLLSTVAGIYLTGALHEDGFADVCDGFGGGHTPQKITEIMSDPRIGAYGAIGIGLLLAVKMVALGSLPLPVSAWALLSAHPLSRLAATALIWRMAYAKPEGKASLVAQPMTLLVYASASAPVLLMLITVLACGGLAAHSVLIAVMAMVLVTIWLGQKFQRHLGGYTGDCLGAVQQLTEVSFYLALLVMKV